MCAQALFPLVVVNGLICRRVFGVIAFCKVCFQGHCFESCFAAPWVLLLQLCS